LAIPDFLCLHTYFRIELSISEKNVIGIWDSTFLKHSHCTSMGLAWPRLYFFGGGFLGFVCWFVCLFGGTQGP
jgi:hypothetical protein